MTPEKRSKDQEDNCSEDTPGSKSSDSSTHRRGREERSRKYATPRKVEEPVQEPVLEPTQEPVQELVLVEEAVKEEPIAIEESKQEVNLEVEEEEVKEVVENDPTEIVPEVKRPLYSESFSKVIFKIYYKTVPKQDLFMIGNHELFANWQDKNLGFPMKWTNGHIWVAELPENIIPSEFEFKFIVKERDGSITWENRENRRFSAGKIIDTLKNNHKYKSYGTTTIFRGEAKFEHNEDTGASTLFFTWSK